MPVSEQAFQKPFVAAMVIPTGVGASIGGFGGDATPEMNLLAAACDVLITHPNVANAACFQKLPDNALYVEGYGLDQFLRGHWLLSPVRHNKIGVVFDSGIEPDMKTLHLNAVNAVRTVYGVDVIGAVDTTEPVRTRCEWTAAGTSSGSLHNPDVILTAARRLTAQGADAIALCVRMPDVTGEDDYQTEGGVDPVGGIEAVLSHLVVSELGVPCAHAPVFHKKDAEPAWDRLVDPRAASEYIVSTFLPCVLTGLARAPRFRPPAQPEPSQRGPYDLSVNDVDALVVPGDALGGVPVLSAVERGIPVIAVENNRTVLNVTPAHFAGRAAHIQTAASYAEAAGMILAMRLGLRLETARPAKIS